MNTVAGPIALHLHQSSTRNYCTAYSFYLSDWLMSAPRANKLYGEVHVFIPDVSDVLSGDQSGTQFSKPVFTLTGGQVSC